MKIQITVKPRNHPAAVDKLGKRKFDFVITDPDIRVAVEALTSHKTINTIHIHALKTLGHEVELTEFATDFIRGKL